MSCAFCFQNTQKKTNWKAEYVHGLEWLHGDLGKLKNGGLIIVISASGTTPEMYDTLLQIQQKIQKNNNDIIIASVMCRNMNELPNLMQFKNNTFIGKLSDINICLGNQSLKDGSNMQDLLGKLPTRSILVTQTFINGVLTELVNKNQITKNDFIDNHPGGSIGKLKK